MRDAYPYLAIYRTEVSRGNPNAERYFRETEARIAKEIDSQRDPAGYQAALDRATTGVGAYRAVRGIQGNLYDPAPLPTQNDRAVYDPAMSAAAPGGSGQQQGRYDPVAAIAEDLAAYQAANARASTLMDPGLTIDDFTPYAQAAIRQQYQVLYGEEFPELRGQVRDYVEWAALQPQGADTSIPAFVRWRDAQEAQAAAASLPYLLPPDPAA